MRKVSLRQFSTSIVLSSVLLATMVMVGAVVRAQDDKQTNAATANTLRVAPLRSDVVADPGDTKTVKITVSNPTDETISVKPVQNDFIAGDEDGTPALILDEDKYAPNHSLKRFMQPLESFNIEPESAKTITARIVIPKDAEAGGYFGAVRFEPTSPDEGGQVNMSASVASLILLRVSGDVNERLNLTDFVVQQNGTTKRFFTNTDNLATLVRFENDSQVQLGPIGKISIKKGDNVVHDTNFNDKQPRDMILPNSARRWNLPIKDIGGFGKYTVVGTFTYGDKNQSIDVSRTFWVIPVWVIASVGVLATLIVITMLTLISKRRQRRT